MNQSRLPKVNGKINPQATVLFRTVAFFSKLRLGYLVHRRENTRITIVLFLITAATAALGIITATAYLAKLPLLYPPLAPSAFILFYTPMAPAASPRSVVLSHGMGLALGVLCLMAASMIWPQSALLDPTTMNWHRILVIGVSTAALAVLMVVFRCVHPPAAATAMIAALGYIISPLQILGLMGAVILLVLEAFFFIRILGGVPYPLWKSDSSLMRSHRILSEGVETRGGFWEEAVAQIYRKGRRGSL